MSGEVWWLSDMNPKWGEIKSYKYEKNKLFSFENPAVKAKIDGAQPSAAN